MAASTLLLATNPAPVSPSSHLRQTLPSTTAAPRTSQPRSARRCVPASSPNPQQPIVHHLRSFLEAATVKSKCISPVPPDHPHFALGMHVQDGIAKRLQWKALHAEIARAHAVTTNTNSSMPPKATQQFLLDLSTSIANSVYDLLKDERCENEDARTNVTDVLVWSDAQNARKAIVNDVVSTFRSAYESDLQHKYRFPVVILGTEKAAFIEPYHVRADDTQTSGQNVCDAQAQFLELWRNAVADDADVLTIVGDNSDTVKASLEAVLESDGHQWISTPVLLVLYSSVDSVITANLSDIRRTCEHHNIKLCVEGPALAFLAQAARPSDPDECLRSADILLTNPGLWFGFHDCAHITIHSSPKPLYPTQRTHEIHRSLDANMRSMNLQDQRRDNAVAPVVRLWTMISQIGVPVIRERVDHATHISEAFIYHLRDCEGLLSTYEGVGCVVRLSYELSRSEQVNFEVQESEVISTINKSLYKYVTQEVGQIPIFLTVVNNVCVLQFSPMRLLDAGTFWMPQDTDVKKLTDELKSRAAFYHLCQLGAVVFVERLATCADIELVNNDGVAEDALLRYGAFRVVPSDWKHAWVCSTSGKHTVTTLTEMLVSVLSDSFANLLVENPSLKELLNTCAAEEVDYSYPNLSEKLPFRNEEPFIKHFIPWLSAKKSRRRSISSQDKFIELPFTFFIHFDDSNVKVPFISVEPKQNYAAHMAYRQACTAAEIVVVALQVVLEKWGKKSHSRFFNARPIHAPSDEECNQIEQSSTERPSTEFESLGCLTASNVHSSSKHSSNLAAEGKCTDVEGEASLSSDRYLSALDSSEDCIVSCAHDRQQSLKPWKYNAHREPNEQEPGVLQVDECNDKAPPNDKTHSPLQMQSTTEDRANVLGLLLPVHKNSNDESALTDSDFSDESDKNVSGQSSGYQDSDRSYEETDSSSATTEASNESEDEGYSGDDETENDTDDETDDETDDDTDDEIDGEDEAGSTGSESSDDEDNVNPRMSKVCNGNSDSKTKSSLDSSKNSTWLPTLLSSRWRWPSYFRFEREQHDQQTHLDSASQTYTRERNSQRNLSSEQVSLRPSSCSVTETDESGSVTSDDSFYRPSREDFRTEARKQSTSRRSKNPNNQMPSLRIKPWRMWNREPSSRSTSGTSNGSSSASDARSSMSEGETSHLSSESQMSSDSDSEYDRQTNRSASTVSSRSSYSSYSATTEIERNLEVQDSEYSETPKPDRASWFSFFGYSSARAHDSDDDDGESVRTTRKRKLRRRSAPRNL